MAQQLELHVDEMQRRLARAVYFFAGHKVFRLERAAGGHLKSVGIGRVLRHMDTGNAFGYLSPHDDVSRRQTAAAVTLPEELKSASEAQLQSLCDGAQAAGCICCMCLHPLTLLAVSLCRPLVPTEGAH
jgi:hypothetical protein